jgi:hypothetical protein
VLASPTGGLKVVSIRVVGEKKHQQQRKIGRGILKSRMN